MALTSFAKVVAQLDEMIESDVLLGVYTAVGEASYTSGGADLDFTDGLLGRDYRAGYRVWIQGEDLGYVFRYDHANSKVKAFRAGTAGAVLDEVTAAVDLSGEILSFLVVGQRVVT